MLIIIYYIMLFLSKKNILLYSKHGIEFKLYVNVLSVKRNFVHFLYLHGIYNVSFIEKNIETDYIMINLYHF